MPYHWTRCRRCARTLKTPDAVRRGIGDDCATLEPAPLHGTAQLMAAIDTLLSRGHYLPPLDRFTRADLNLYAAVINYGVPLRASTRRLILKRANKLQEQA